jgi:glycosyltransferase involved in cell wall biosynthesis
MSSIFYFFLRSSMRQDLIRGGLRIPGASYLLYGLDHLDHHGFTASHNLANESTANEPQGRLAGWINCLATGLGGVGGDVQTVLTHHRAANRSALILSTVDTVGIPLVFFKRAGLIRRPLLYVSIGLPERIQKITATGILRLYRNAFQHVDRFIAYGWEEALWIRRWLGLPEDSPKVVFMPFGVDSDYFSPRPDIVPSIDVLTIGADPQRDFKTLFRIASRQPRVTFRVIASKDHAAGFTTVPGNVEILVDLPFPEIRDHLATARVIALPIHENTYSAGTTTLLQAMAMARPVVVSKTGAIRN